MYIYHLGSTYGSCHQFFSSYLKRSHSGLLEDHCTRKKAPKGKRPGLRSHAKVVAEVEDPWDSLTLEEEASPVEIPGASSQSSNAGAFETQQHLYPQHHHYFQDHQYVDLQPHLGCHHGQSLQHVDQRHQCRSYSRGTTSRAICGGLSVWTEPADG